MRQETLGSMLTRSLRGQTLIARSSVSMRLVILTSSKLIRLHLAAHSLRLLATHHIFFEIRPDVFKNNRCFHEISIKIIYSLTRRGRISSFIDTDKTVTQISDELSTCLGILPNSFTLYSPGQKYEGTDGMAAFVACACVLIDTLKNHQSET